MTPPVGTSITPSKGEVWLVNLDPLIGDEMRKTRPAVIMSADALGVLALRVVVPLTNWRTNSAIGNGWCGSIRPRETAWRNRPRPMPFKCAHYRLDGWRGDSVG